MDRMFVFGNLYDPPSPPSLSPLMHTYTNQSCGSLLPVSREMLILEAIAGFTGSLLTESWEGGKEGLSVQLLTKMSTVRLVYKVALEANKPP